MTGNVKPRPLRVVEKGFFRGKWSSEQCHAIIKYRPATDSIVFIKVYGQKDKEHPNGAFVKPWFPKDAVERLLDYARRRHEEGYARNRQHKGKHRKLKGHKKELCELCAAILSDSEE